MAIYFALCGNAYTENLAKIYIADAGFTMIHRSNAIFLQEQFVRLFVVLFAMLMRYLISPIQKSKFIILTPHFSGTYGFLTRMLKPHQCILIDDGITFEYWSEFHDQFILPLYIYPKTFLMVGPHFPNWLIVNQKDVKFELVERHSIVEGMLSPYKISALDPVAVNNKLRVGWLIDDGKMEGSFVGFLLDKIKLEYRCDKVAVLWHPARRIKNNSHYMSRPAEVKILCDGSDIAIVMGRASTTLFNIAAYSPNVKVVSLASGQHDLDAAAHKCGIFVVDINEYEEN
jgi:hypothetical protein